MRYLRNFIAKGTGALLCLLLALTQAQPRLSALRQEGTSQQSVRPASMQLEDLLDRAAARTIEYTDIFKDLMAEERQLIELYDSSGQLMRRRRITSDFVVYQSQLDSKLMVEYRNVREVDGAAVADRQERVMSLAERLVKVDSVTKELDRIDREASRYDLNYSVKGYTLNQGMALQKEVRAAFRFEAAGREMLDGHEVVRINYQQIAQHPQIKFNLSLPKIKSSSPLYRGRLWLDAETAQLWREEREIVVRLPKLADPVALMSFEFRYAPSKFKILVPHRIVFTTLGSIKRVEGQPPILSPGGRVSFEYGSFEQFDVTVKPGSFTPQNPQ
ncbi:MAG TPA: hypothetical protein VGC64_04730 [Pyrinomonadaceae bacterium]|jgi:hypothetical protein